MKEARRLGEENRALKEEKQQLVAMGAEASRGTNLLQQQLDPSVSQCLSRSVRVLGLSSSNVHL